MKNILFVSQSSIVIKSIISHCEKAGDKVTHLETGADAVIELLANNYDLLITSLFLDKLDGIQLINIVKNSNAINSSIPVIMLTSDENPESMFSKGSAPDFVIHKDENTLSKFENIYKKINSESTMASTKVLFVDDDKFVQKMVKLWLSKIKFIELTICGSVAEVKELVKNDYDIIVSDNLLGDGEFSDVIKLIQNSHLKDTPILIYTGSADKMDRETIFKMGNIIDILPKPFDLKFFLNIVKDL